MANRIKDVLQPELYEYYKSHRGKYQRFASDIALLQAKLFKDMVDNGVLPKKKHGWEYECDCTVWLNDITLKINTFSDFHKLYKNRLKAFKFKSPEYYAECEKIVAENDVEFVRNAMRAKSIRNYVARNYSAPMPQEENCNERVVLESEGNTKQLKQFKKANGQKTNEDRAMFGQFDYELKKEWNYYKKKNVEYLITQNNKNDTSVWINSVLSSNLEDFCRVAYKIPLSAICERYSDYLDSLPKDSKEFKLKVITIMIEDEENIKQLRFAYPYGDMSYKDCVEYVNVYFGILIGYGIFILFSFILKDVLYAIFCYLTAFASFIFSFISVLFCGIKDNYDSGVINLYEYATDDSFIFWKWIVSVLSIVIVFVYIIFTLKNIKTLKYCIKKYHK